MSTKLTHEQAAILRLIDKCDELFDRDALQKSDLGGLLQICLYGSEGESCLVLNMSGVEALAQYNAEHVTLSREDANTLLTVATHAVGSIGLRFFTDLFQRIRTALEGK